ncbi:MAG TPA: ribonuclease HIII [Bacilli bacterium]|nr:ribonuclease HIII [Bacilli bacterium]
MRTIYAKIISMDTASIKLDKEQIKRLIGFFDNYKVAVDGEYVFFKAIYEQTIIRVYANTHHDYQKVTFSGPSALKLATKFDANYQPTTKPLVKESAAGFLTFDPQIGSDEVGFGDFFGPIVVTGAYVSESDMDSISTFKIDDSKKMNDKYIMEIGPLIEHKYDHVSFVINNDKLNELFAKGYNLNKIKAMLHNRALRILAGRHPDYKTAYIDQFCSLKSYLEYIEEPIIERVVLRTKAESLFPSVALASVIARYTFLKEMAKLGKIYHTTFPLGASTKVDAFAKDFIQKHGRQTMSHVCKTKFRNWKDLGENN